MPVFITLSSILGLTALFAYLNFSIIVQGLTIARLFSTDRLQGMLAPAAGAAPDRP